MPQSLSSRIESLLFVAQKPLTIKKISELVKADPTDVQTCVVQLSIDYTNRKSGIVLLVHNDSVELATHPENTNIVTSYTREEVTGELTRAGLETLTVIAYRGPLTKHELEQIRGVNCTLILRNLMMRGYIDTKEKKGELHYSLSFDFLRHVGVRNTAELPDYESLNSDERLNEFLSEQHTV